MTQPTWETVLQDACELVRRSADRRGMIRLSPEVASALGRIGSAPPAAAPAVHASSASAGDLDDLTAQVAGCTQCELHKTRTQTVFGAGDPAAALVFVGEAPGADEDRQGLPFVGRAGQLLTDIIEKGMKLDRSQVYICNVLKCRPPENRDPKPEEKELCEPFLKRQLELICPKVICALGAHAARTLLKTDAPIGQLRGKWHFYNGIPLRATYHPAYLLRNPADKRKCWDDIQEVMKVLRGEVHPMPGLDM